MKEADKIMHVVPEEIQYEYFAKYSQICGVRLWWRKNMVGYVLKYTVINDISPLLDDDSEAHGPGSTSAGP